MVQDDITAGVTESIVDLLEPINVDMTNGDMGIGVLCQRGQGCIETTPIKKPREIIMVSGIAGFGLALLQLLIAEHILGNVPLGPDEARFAVDIDEVPGT
jgi:hypothetical protein